MLSDMVEAIISFFKETLDPIVFLSREPLIDVIASFFRGPFDTLLSLFREPLINAIVSFHRRLLPLPNSLLKFSFISLINRENPVFISFFSFGQIDSGKARKRKTSFYSLIRTEWRERILICKKRRYRRRKNSISLVRMRKSISTQKI